MLTGPGDMLEVVASPPASRVESTAPGARSKLLDLTVYEFTWRVHAGGSALGVTHWNTNCEYTIELPANLATVTIGDFVYGTWEHFFVPTTAVRYVLRFTWWTSQPRA
jgi:hypothetical protein